MYGKLFPPQRRLGSWLQHHANESKVFKFTPQRTGSFSFAPCGKRVPGKGNRRWRSAGARGEGWKMRAGRLGWRGGRRAGDVGRVWLQGWTAEVEGGVGAGQGATKRDNIGVFTPLTRPEILGEGGEGRTGEACLAIQVGFFSQSGG